MSIWFSTLYLFGKICHPALMYSLYQDKISSHQRFENDQWVSVAKTWEVALIRACPTGVSMQNICFINGCQFWCFGIYQPLITVILWSARTSHNSFNENWIWKVTWPNININNLAKYRQKATSNISTLTFTHF